MLLVGDVLPMIARKFPDETSAVYEGRRFTFRETNERMLRLCRALLDLGVLKGDRIAIMQTNCPQYLEAMLAIAHIGAVVVPVNFRLRAHEVEYIVSDSGATVLFVGDRYVSLIESMRGLNMLAQIKHFICFEGTAKAMHDYENLLLGESPKIYENSEMKDSDLVKIQYTSGTTGQPKGAMITHRGDLSRLTNHVLNNLSTDDRVYCSGTMFHIAGFGINLSAWLQGAAIHILKQFEAQAVAEMIEKEKLTSCFLVPSMINFILNLPDAGRYDFSSLRYISYGAAPMPQDLLKRAIAVFDCGFYNLFGASEGGTQTYLKPGDHKVEGTPEELRRLGSVGKAIPSSDVRVVNEHEDDVQPGEVGEIIVKSGSNMIGYWQRPEESAKALRNGWLYLGDLATVDAAGYIYLVDRKKDMIIRGGENIYPVEIENVLYQHPKVLEAAVVGIPDEAWGEFVQAVVVLKPAETAAEEDMITYCKKHLASYKCPTSVHFVEKLPRNSMGKVLKHELRDAYGPKSTSS